MLNIYELSDLHQFKEKVEDEHIKELLGTVLFEYEEYIKVGTVKRCNQLKDMADYRPSDFINAIDNISRYYKDELEMQKRYYESELYQAITKSNKRR
jgi:hypothetical protein